MIKKILFAVLIATASWANAQVIEEFKVKPGDRMPNVVDNATYKTFTVILYSKDDLPIHTIENVTGTLTKTADGYRFKVDPVLPFDKANLKERVKKIEVRYIGTIKRDDGVEKTVDYRYISKSETIANAIRVEGEDRYRLSIAPGIGYTTMFGGALRNSGKDTYTPATTAYIHFPFGRDFSRRIIGGLDGPSTRLCLSIGTPISGGRAYLIGPTVLFGDYNLALTFGLAFANHSNAAGSNRKIGGFIGLSYTAAAGGGK